MYSVYSFLTIILCSQKTMRSNFTNLCSKRLTWNKNFSSFQSRTVSSNFMRAALGYWSDGELEWTSRNVNSLMLDADCVNADFLRNELYAVLAVADVRYFTLIRSSRRTDDNSLQLLHVYCWTEERQILNFNTRAIKKNGGNSHNLVFRMC